MNTYFKFFLSSFKDAKIEKLMRYISFIWRKNTLNKTIVRIDANENKIIKIEEINKYLFPTLLTSISSCQKVVSFL